MEIMNKPTLATIWCDGCSGCHMSFLDNDERIIDILRMTELVYSPIIDIKEFPQNVDITLVEGAINSEEDVEKIYKVRKNSKTLVAFGDCAVTGNVPSLRNPFGREETLINAYPKDVVDRFEEGSLPLLLPKALPLNKVVHVDFFIPGCPPPPDAIFEILKLILSGESPVVTEYTRFGR